MSELPSTDFDNEIDLTTGTDTIPGQDGPESVAGDDLILGEMSGAEDSGLNTLNGSDTIDGGDGIDTLRLAADGGKLSIGNFSLTNTEVFEARNLADQLDVNLAFATGVETLWFNNNFGDKTTFSAVQAPVDVVVTGGDAELFVEYVNGVAVANQSVLVDGADSKLHINKFNLDVMIPDLTIHSQGTASDLNLKANGQKNWTIMGDADLTIKEGGDSDLTTVNASGLAGETGAVAFSLQADMSDNGGSGPATVLAQGDTFDTLVLDFDGSSDALVKTGLRADDVTLNNADAVTLKTGNGHDTIEINNAGGDVFLGSGKGRDTVSVHTTDGGNLTGDTGTDSNNADSLYLEVSGSVGTAAAAFRTGGGDDYVYGSVGVDLTVDLGDGNNGMLTWSGQDTNVTALDGDDYVYVNVGDDLVANLGDGDNELYLNVANNGDGYHPDDPYYAADITVGAGNDFVRASVDGHLMAALGAGDDVIGMPNVEGTVNIEAGSGNDEIRTGFRGISNEDTIKGGEGTDTVFAKRDDDSGVDNGLEALNSGGSFSGVTSVEAISILDDQNQAASQSVAFDGGTTGANASGVRNYMFEMDDWSGDGQILSNYDLTNIASGSTFDIGLNGGSLDFFNIDLVAGADTSATVNLHLKSSTTWSDFEVDDMGELTFNALDEDNNMYTIPTVTIGGPTTFTGNELATLNLTGDAHITMQSVVSPSLATIAGAGMTGNARLTLDDVAGAIAVTTGIGSDTIVGNDENTAYNVDTSGGGSAIDGNDSVTTNDMDDTIITGSGNDTVRSGSGIDTINMGTGSDNAYFDAGELTSADTIAGDTGYDYVRINNGSGGVTGNDAFFYKWSGIEELYLGDGDDNIELNAIASDSGLQVVNLSSGGADTLTIGEGFTNPLTAQLWNFGGDIVVVDGSIATAPLTLDAFEAAFDGNDTFTGGAGSDTINMRATAGDADLTGVTGFETINVYTYYGQDVSITTADENVGAGETLTVTSYQTYLYGYGLTLDASAETDDGAFNVTGSWYNDMITTMGGDDVINTQYGDDIVDAGDGNNTVTVGLGNSTWDGNNVVTTGTGNDTIFGGSSTQFGDTDTISSGAGMDTIYGYGGVDIIDAGDHDDIVDGGSGDDQITGGLGADSLTGGSGSDTFFYNALAESSDGTLDTINDFVSGTDLVDLTGVGATVFNGNGTDGLNTQGLVNDGSGTIEAVFQKSTSTLWVDINDDGTLNGNDLQILITGQNANGLAVDGSDLVLV